MKNKIGNTILEQLGGNQFIAMTGSKNLVALEDGLQFKPGKNSKGVNSVVINLESNDTYTMTFHKINMRHYTVKELGNFTMVYADMLQGCFTKGTGLATHL